MSVEFDEAGFEDFGYWIQKDRKKAMRILKLIRDIQRTPFEGLGKPEPLRHGLTGYWSRRIDSEHRLVYRCSEQTVRILSCRYHYS